MKGLDHTDVRTLRSQVDGTVTSPSDSGYDEARKVWNSMHDRRPAVVVQAQSVEDVQRALDFARARGLPLAIRGGGHSVAGHGTIDGGMVIDLSRMQSVEVDREARTVRVDPGVTLGVLDRATTRYDLAVPVGVVSKTGVGGLTLGGGVGWLTRAYGLALDNLRSAQVVTADGQLRTASAQENPDLFWGLRGGGGNFGIVTRFEFNAHPLASAPLWGTAHHRRESWTEALAFYADWTAKQPDDLTTVVTFITPPTSWGLPEHLVGRQLMLIGFAWAGMDIDEGRRAVGVLEKEGSADLVVAEPAPWVDLQSAADDLFEGGVRAYWKSLYFNDLDERTIPVIVEHAERASSLQAGVDIHHMEGAFARVAEEEAAFPNRSARFWLNIYTFWNEAARDAEHISWVRDFFAAMAPFASEGMYVNFQGAESDHDPLERAKSIYGAAKLSRLQHIKDRYDPENVFRLNVNIPPTA